MRLARMRNSNRTSPRMMAVLFSLLFVFAVACGDDDNGGGGDSNNTNNTLRDAGGDDVSQPDGGTDEDGGTQEDGGGDEDTGGDPDGGTDQCEPLDPAPADQADCSILCQDCGPDSACVRGTDPNSGDVVMACQPSGDAGQGETCNQSTPCQAGFGCFLPNQDATEGTCQRFCRLGSDDAPQCEGEEVCAQILEDDDRFGACSVPEENCTQWPNDSCGDGQNCYPLQNGGTECFDFNDTAQAGDSCTAPDDCNDAQLCAGDPEGGGNQCYDRCDPNAADPACGDGQACAPLQNAPDQGVCVDQQ